MIKFACGKISGNQGFSLFLSFEMLAETTRSCMILVNVIHTMIVKEIVSNFFMIFLDAIYLKAQNFSSVTESVLCLRDQVFPLLFPIQTS